MAQRLEDAANDIWGNSQDYFIEIVCMSIANRATALRPRDANALATWLHCGDGSVQLKGNVFYQAVLYLSHAVGNAQVRGGKGSALVFDNVGGRKSEQRSVRTGGDARHERQ